MRAANHTALAVLLALAPLAGCGGRAAEEEHAARDEHPAGDDAGAEHAAAEHEPGTVVLDAEAQARADLGTEPLVTTSRPSELETVGIVEDAQALSEPVEALAVAKAEADKARAERDAALRERDRQVRLRSQDRIASAREVEAAEARLRTAEAGSRAAASAVAAREGALERRFAPVLVAKLKPGSPDLARLLHQDDLLVRATLPAGEAAPAEVATARVESRAGTSVAARSVTAARQIDPRLLGAAYDLVVEAAGTGLLPGMTARVFLATGAPVAAVAVPEAAVVAWQGRDWIYVKEGEDRFVRHEVPRRSGGLRFLPEGEKPVGPVVVRGAALLLSEELKSQIQGEE